MGVLEEILDRLDGIEHRLDVTIVEHIEESPRVLKIATAAEYLSVGVPTLRRWVAILRIPYIRLSGNRIGFDRRDLDVFIEENKIGEPESH